MQDYGLFVLARAVHVIGVILWIGGVAFVTTVLIPSIRRMEDPDSRLDLFEQLESGFGSQAKAVTLITGASGLYMLVYTNAWQNYTDPHYWWLHLMTLIWALFTIILFVLEPILLHQWFHQQATDNSDRAFKLLHRMHIILLSLSLLAVFGAVAGSHGLQLF